MGLMNLIQSHFQTSIVRVLGAWKKVTCKLEFARKIRYFFIQLSESISFVGGLRAVLLRKVPKGTFEYFPSENVEK